MPSTTIQSSTIRKTLTIWSALKTLTWKFWNKPIEKTYSLIDNKTKLQKIIISDINQQQQLIYFPDLILTISPCNPDSTASPVSLVLSKFPGNPHLPVSPDWPSTMKFCLGSTLPVKLSSPVAPSLLRCTGWSCTKKWIYRYCRLYVWENTKDFCL